ncbi:sigma-54 dependent transcriptional regulator [bacterium]|nr:sigma-54 dependent transcriptional regulator [bacterium]
MNKETIAISGNYKQGVDFLNTLFKKENYKLEILKAEELLREVKKKDFDLILFCVGKDDQESAVNFVLDIKNINDLIPIVVFSDSGSWEDAVLFMKTGISEFVHKEASKDKIKKVVAHAVKMYHMTRRVYLLHSDDGKSARFEGMVGQSEAMQENFKMITAVAKSNATVLITGESGTGKELVAKAIHKRSERAGNRFVDLNCGAIPRDLLENELFGHEKGAFTGAHKRYNGSFEAAHKGTLFMDEISEMDPLLQVKLLRVLQERSFMRIGGTQKIDVDVRIIAATNRNLQQHIQSGQFREDLFYRLNVVNINIPSLKERRDDIPLLAQHFLEYYSAKNDKIFLDFASDALEALINYDWPGNVRELENTIERVVVLNNDSQVKLKFLPKNIQKVRCSISFNDLSRPGLIEEQSVIPLDDLERQAIEVAMMKFQGNVAIVAKKLNIGQATLYRKIKQYGLAH